MTFADYIDAVRTDAIDAIERGDYDEYTDAQDVYDAMWIDDSITGNGSGSYTFNSYKAKQNVADLLFDDDFIFELESIGDNVADLLKKGAEAVDVTARCLALGFVYSDIEEAWEERHPEEDTEE